MSIFKNLFGPPNVEQLNVKRDVDGLIKALGYEKDPKIRQSAVAVLGELGDPKAVQPLITTLSDKDPDVRAHAAKSLGMIGDARAVEPLVKLIKDDINDEVRKAAIQALKKLGDPRAVELLLMILRDENDKVIYIHVVEALSKLGKSALTPLLSALRNGGPQTRMGAAEALGNIGDPQASKDLAAALRDEGKYYWEGAEKVYIREKAAKALEKIGTPALEPLIVVIKDRDPFVRSEASKLLVKIGEPSVEPLILILREKCDDLIYADVRMDVADALGKIGDARAVEPLIVALKDEFFQVRHHAATALGKIGDARAVEPLIVALRDGMYLVRQQAADALGDIGDPRAVEPLRAILGDRDEGVRQATAEALRKIGNRQVVKPLKTLQTNQEPSVRESAGQARQAIAETKSVVVPVANSDLSGNVSFAGTRQKGNNTYHEYRTQDAESARLFLRTQKVDESQVYITVETPEGIWGIDREGLFLVHLLPWQMELSCAEFDGEVVEPPTTFSASLYHNKIADNFIATIKCSRCGRTWQDGLSDRQVIVVRCPQCHGYNRVDTTKFLKIGSEVN